ncbi:MAG TPA: FapA family protein, partial [Bordetella sp.]|uniref:FapA family protein n=1 Tax=Bordetella sp. TaxID=28081 RepID=UPI002ED42A15
MPADLPKDLLEGLPIDLLDGLPADPPSDVPVDGRFHLYLDNDHMAASISIEPPLHGGAAVAEEQVRAEMTARGVVAGILDDALRQVIEQGIGSYVCIAKGLEPTPGRPAVFTNLIERPLDHHAQAAEDEDEDGDEDEDTYARIDYRDLGNLILVTPGVPLMRRTPAVPSIPGFDITGKVIELAPVKDQPFADHLAGVALAPDDPNLLIAAISGAPKIMEHGVSVVAMVEVDAVNLDTG